MSNRGTCALCQGIDVELRKSHIFPEFLYGNLYDPSLPGFRVYSSVKNTPSKKQPQGFYKRLLCANCESHLNENFENKVKSVIQKIQEQAPVRHDQALLINDVDYTSFKLFAISLIWRAAVAKHDAFKKVQLEEHAERMRQMLLTCEPGDAQLYPCILFMLPKNAPPTFLDPRRVSSRPMQGLLDPRRVSPQTFHRRRVSHSLRS